MLTKCIICQSDSYLKPIASDTDRKRVREAANVDDDDVCKRLNSVPDDTLFVCRC